MVSRAESYLLSSRLESDRKTCPLADVIDEFKSLFRRTGTRAPGAACTRSSQCSTNKCQDKKCRIPTGSSCAAPQIVNFCAFGNVCNSGICQLPIGAGICKANTDCTSTLCQSGTCRIRTNGDCSRYHWQCSRGRACVAGTCLVNNGQAALNADSTTCASGYCQNSLGGCICKDAPAGTVCNGNNPVVCADPLLCNGSSGKCQAGPNGPCSTNNDCSNNGLCQNRKCKIPLDGKCSTSKNNFCASGSVCAGNNPRSQTCLKAKGQTCAADGECYQGLCSNNQCEPTNSRVVLNGGHCNNNYDCKSRICSSVTGKCLASDSLPCTLDSDCKSGLCSSNVCTAAQSYRVLNGKHCLANADCKSGLCGSSSGLCLASNNKSCHLDSDCKSGLCSSNTCNALNSSSITTDNHCLANADCVSGGCNAGTCLAPINQACLGDPDCASGLCSSSTCTRE